MRANKEQRGRRSDSGSRTSSPGSSRRFLAPGHRDSWLLAMPVAAQVRRPVAKPRDETRKLLHGFLVSLPTFLGGGQLGIAEDACPGIAAGPGNDRGRTGGKQIDPIEGTVLLIE